MHCWHEADPIHDRLSVWTFVFFFITIQKKRSTQCWLFVPINHWYTGICSTIERKCRWVWTKTKKLYIASSMAAIGGFIARYNHVHNGHHQHRKLSRILYVYSINKCCVRVLICYKHGWMLNDSGQLRKFGGMA